MILITHIMIPKHIPWYKLNEIKILMGTYHGLLLKYDETEVIFTMKACI